MVCNPYIPWNTYNILEQILRWALIRTWVQSILTLYRCYGTHSSSKNWKVCLLVQWKTWTCNPFTAVVFIPMNMQDMRASPSKIAHLLKLLFSFTPQFDFPFFPLIHNTGKEVNLLLNCATSPSTWKSCSCYAPGRR